MKREWIIGTISRKEIGPRTNTIGEVRRKAVPNLGGPAMFVQQVLEVMGFPAKEVVAAVWPTDQASFWQARTRQLNESLERRFHLLIRRRRAIECIRQRIAMIEQQLAWPSSEQRHQAVNGWSAVGSPGTQLLQVRLAADRAALEQLEQSYQKSLARIVEGKRKLAGLKTRMLEARVSRTQATARPVSGPEA